jgi:HSP20 family protein
MNLQQSELPHPAMHLHFFQVFCDRFTLLNKEYLTVFQHLPAGILFAQSPMNLMSNALKKEVIMTLVKWNRERGSNGNRTSDFNSGLMWPALWNSLGRPFMSNDLVQDFFNDLTPASGSIGTTLPAVNIDEHDDDIVIEVAAPGMRKNDFKLEIEDNQLRISYEKERKQEEGKKNSNQWRREFSYQSFERNFSLPAMVDSEKIQATYTDGILKITVPKKEEARRKPARSIEIK